MGTFLAAFDAGQYDGILILVVLIIAASCFVYLENRKINAFLRSERK